jgi:hypothetical protein
MRVASLLRRLTLVAGLALFAGGALAAEVMNRDADGVAIGGYDPVAYFTWQRPAKGKPDYQLDWEDAHWRFATAEHRDLFAADPERYAPRFGGFCTGGVAMGVLAPLTDATAWIIIDGRLYLHVDGPTRDETAADPQAMIGAAEAQWPTLAGGRQPGGP